MKVYNIGLTRTGTKSLNELFNEVGFNTKHSSVNMLDYIIEHRYVVSKKDLWIVDNTYYSDTPIWHPEFWKLVDIESGKIIHSFRDKNSWINSIQNFSYFKGLKYRPRDKYWYKDYFDDISYGHLSNIYDNHMLNVSKLSNILSIDTTIGDNKSNVSKICDFLDIEYKDSYSIPVNSRK